MFDIFFQAKNVENRTIYSIVSLFLIYKKFANLFIVHKLKLIFFCEKCYRIFCLHRYTAAVYGNKPISELAWWIFEIFGLRGPWGILSLYLKSFVHIYLVYSQFLHFFISLCLLKDLLRKSLITRLHIYITLKIRNFQF